MYNRQGSDNGKKGKDKTGKIVICGSEGQGRQNEANSTLVKAEIFRLMSKRTEVT